MLTTGAAHRLVLPRRLGPSRRVAEPDVRPAGAGAGPGLRRPPGAGATGAGAGVGTDSGGGSRPGASAAVGLPPEPPGLARSTARPTTPRWPDLPGTSWTASHRKGPPGTAAWTTERELLLGALEDVAVPGRRGGGGRAWASARTGSSPGAPDRAAGRHRGGPDAARRAQAGPDGRPLPGAGGAARARPDGAVLPAGQLVLPAGRDAGARCGGPSPGTAIRPR